MDSQCSCCGFFEVDLRVDLSVCLSVCLSLFSAFSGVLSIVICLTSLQTSADGVLSRSPANTAQMDGEALWQIIRG